MRKMRPLSATHPLVKDQTLCPVCTLYFNEGDEVTLIPIGPDNDVDREKMERGRPYNTEAVPVHWMCRP